MLYFANKDDENRFFNTVVALLQEWGPENVVVTVPKDWDQYKNDRLPPTIVFRDDALTKINILVKDPANKETLVLNLEFAIPNKI